MPLSDLSPLAYFKELHLLPRVIFSLGGAILFGSLVIRDVPLVLFGIGIVFAAVALNFLLGLTWEDPNPPYRTHFWWGGLFQFMIAAAIASSCIYISAYHYRHGVFPPRFTPDPQVQTHK